MFDAASNILFRGTGLARFEPTRLVPRATLKISTTFSRATRTKVPHQQGPPLPKSNALLLVCPKRRPEVAGSGCLRREYPNARRPPHYGQTRILEMERWSSSVKMRGAVRLGSHYPKTLNRKPSLRHQQKSNGAHQSSSRPTSKPRSGHDKLSSLPLAQSKASCSKSILARELDMRSCLFAATMVPVDFSRTYVQLYQKIN